jgi:hypothetical protein
MNDNPSLKKRSLIGTSHLAQGGYMMDCRICGQYILLSVGISDFADQFKKDHLHAHPLLGEKT